MSIQYIYRVTGQPPPAATHLSPIARRIVAGVNGGRIAATVGFVWREPHVVRCDGRAHEGVLVLSGTEEAA